MEMTSVTPALWAAVQAITVQQFALYTLIGLAATAALYVLVRRLAPEASHLAHKVYIYATTPRSSKQHNAQNRLATPTQRLVVGRSLFLEKARDDTI